MQHSSRPNSESAPSQDHNRTLTRLYERTFIRLMCCRLVTPNTFAQNTASPPIFKTLYGCQAPTARVLVVIAVQTTATKSSAQDLQVAIRNFLEPTTLPRAVFARTRHALSLWYESRGTRCDTSTLTVVDLVQQIP